MMTGARFDLSWWQRGLALTLFVGASAVAASGHLSAQSAGQPYALLLPASSVTFPSETDSNSPALWELVDGQWYPQVIGLDEGQGTDAYAGATARFFMAGRSDYTIRFGRR